MPAIVDQCAPALVNAREGLSPEVIVVINLRPETRSAALAFVIFSRSLMVIKALWHATVVRLHFACIILLSLNPALASPNELQRLAAAHFAANQGVFVQAEDGTILVAQQESHPVHPASVTKVATTLALLERLKDKHRFETRFVAGGPVVDGKLDGDLIV